MIYACFNTSYKIIIYHLIYNEIPIFKLIISNYKKFLILRSDKTEAYKNFYYVRIYK